MTSLERQLADVFARGLKDEPKLRASIEEALNSYGGHDSKSTKAEANYGEAKEDGDSCESCKHFNPGADRCDVVSGVIRSSGISDLYEPIDEETSEDTS